MSEEKTFAVTHTWVTRSIGGTRTVSRIAPDNRALPIHIPTTWK